MQAQCADVCTLSTVNMSATHAVVQDLTTAFQRTTTQPTDLAVANVASTPFTAAHILSGHVSINAILVAGALSYTLPTGFALRQDMEALLGSPLVTGDTWIVTLTTAVGFAPLAANTLTVALTGVEITQVPWAGVGAAVLVGADSANNGQVLKLALTYTGTAATPNLFNLSTIQRVISLT